MSSAPFNAAMIADALVQYAKPKQDRGGPLWVKKQKVPDCMTKSALRSEGDTHHCSLRNVRQDLTTSAAKLFVETLSVAN